MFYASASHDPPAAPGRRNHPVSEGQARAAKRVHRPRVMSGCVSGGTPAPALPATGGMRSGAGVSENAAGRGEQGAVQLDG
jgi:hypothetical protein